MTNIFETIEVQPVSNEEDISDTENYIFVLPQILKEDNHKGSQSENATIVEEYLIDHNCEPDECNKAERVTGSQDIHSENKSQDVKMLPSVKGQQGKSHECDICKKRFTTAYALKAHKRTHTGEKPYTCPDTGCQKRFVTSGDLQKHIRTHTGERPFKCDVCCKAFTTSNIKKVHMRIHTGEKPYKCTHQGCERKFSSATNYRNHLRIHTGEKPYVCNIQNCQKRFTEYSSLYKHYSVHSQKKKFECSFCKRQYRQLSSINMHISTVHKDEHNTLDNCIDPKNPKPAILRSAPCKLATPVLRNSNSSTISQHIILQPQNGTVSSVNSKTVSFKGKNGESLSVQEFLDLQIKNVECDQAKEVNEATIHIAEDSISSCGSEAVLLLAFPPPACDSQFVIDGDSKF